MEHAQETLIFSQPTAVEAPPPPLPSVPGHRVEELIGRGGMGKVYRAMQTELGRTVAVKLLAHEPDSKSLARFREEYRAVARLQHPHIAQMYETGSVEGRPYFTQEFLGGGSLSERFGGQPQDARESARIVEIIARAIQFSHEQGILHRDLKPSNILLATDGTPKVTDFGLAKELTNPSGETPKESSGITRTGEILGTPSYMAPEQASGVVSKLGPPADVYSLGAILYEALTGRPPFLAPDPLQTLFMVLSMDPVAPRTLQPKLPKDIETICLKCLDKLPKRRYASAGELADDLQRFLAGKPIVARPIGRTEVAWKWAKRNKSAAFLLTLCAVLFVTMIGAATWAILGNIRLQKANRDIVEAKGETEKKNAALEVAKAESDQSFDLSKSALDEVIKRMSIRLHFVPQAEAVLLDSLKNTCDFYLKLLKIRPNDPAVIQSYAESLSSYSSTLDFYFKHAESDAVAATLEAFLTEKLKEHPENVRLQAVNVRLYQQRKNVAERSSDDARILNVRKQFVKSVDDFLARYPTDIEGRSFEVDRYITSGAMHGDKDNYSLRLADCKTAYALAKKYHEAEPGVPSRLIMLNLAIHQLGTVEELRNNLSVARDIFQEGVDLQTKAMKSAKDPKDFFKGVSDAKMQVARIHLKLTHGDTALEIYREAETMQRELCKLFPLDLQLQYDLAECLSYQGIVLRNEDPKTAIQRMKEAVEILTKLDKASPGNENFQWTKEHYEKLLKMMEGKK